MKSKLISVCLLTLILSIAMVYALDFSVSTPDALTKSKTQTSFTITNTGTEIVNIQVTLPATITDGQGHDLVITPNTALTFTNVAPAEPKTITLTYSNNLNNFIFGDFSKDISVKTTDISNLNNFLTKIVSLKVSNSFCTVGNIGNLTIERLKFTNNGRGTKDKWYLTDEIVTDVRVKNTGDNTIDNIIVSWGLYDKKTGDFIIDDEEKDFDLDKNEKKDLEITFNLDPNDFDSDFNDNDFVFYVKAYSDDLGEDKQCNSDNQAIKIVRDNDLVVLNGLSVDSKEAPCGGTVSGDFQAWNIGDDDQSSVSVLMSNSELGISQKIELGDIDSLSDKKATFDFKVPTTAKEKTYSILFKVMDENGDVYVNSEDKESSSSLILDVVGNCGSNAVPQVQITAGLDSETPEAIAGKQVIVKSNIRNTGEEETTYALSVLGNTGWSSLDSISPSSITLASGQSKIVNIVLNLDSTAEGDKEFTIRATYGNQVTDQKVQLSITPQNKGTTSSNAIVEHLKNNWFIYLIILVNIILILAIIIVIARMVSPRRA